MHHLLSSLYGQTGEGAPTTMTLDVRNARKRHYDDIYNDTRTLALWAWKLPMEPRDLSQLRSLVLKLSDFDKLHTCLIARQIPKQSTSLTELRVKMNGLAVSRRQRKSADTPLGRGELTFTLLPQLESLRSLSQLTVLHLSKVPLAHCQDSWFTVFDFAQLKDLRIKRCYRAGRLLAGLHYSPRTGSEASFS